VSRSHSCYRPATSFAIYGDVHLTSRTALGLIPYTHFGVEMQAGGICENSPGRIRIVSLPQFAGSRATRVENPDATPQERKAAVERAASRIGERRYSLTTNNCEHFAKWCATGVAISHQVIEAIKTFVQLAVIAAAAYLAVLVARATAAEA
jgi:uncharacterized protein YycO